MWCLFLVSLAVPIYGQFISPCPRLFKYEPKRESGKWHGTITLLSDVDLSGVWLRLILDKPSIKLGNWFGEVVTSDNKEYLLKKPNEQVVANVPKKVKFFIEYDPEEAPPQLLSFRLNAKTVCPESGATTESSEETGQLITSSVLSTTAAPRPPAAEGDGDGGGGGGNGNGGGGDDDFFPGDFSFSGPGKPKPNRPRPPLTTNSVTCGTVASKATPLISHGQSTAAGQWPWHAALYIVQKTQLTYACGGTLVSEDHVVTAAHCVTANQSKRKVDPRKLVVYLGKYSLKKFGAFTQDKEVSEIYVHPDYNHTVYYNDIAVMKLSTPVDFTEQVRPCCLWEDKSDLELIINKLGTVVGWGYDENRQLSDSLMQAQMPVAQTLTCIYSNPDFFSRFTFEKNFCAGFRNGTSVCNGDSGGGMVFPKRGTSGRNTVWQLRGVVSLSVALQDQAVCDPDHYVIFTDVAKYVGWIKQILKN